MNLPETLESFGIESFRFSQITKINIPKKVRIIPEGLFSYSKLKTVIIDEESIVTIERSAFHYCGSLEYFSIPKTTTTIGYSAFSYCLSLKSNVIPEKVTLLGNSVFSHCSSLKSLIIRSKSISFESISIYNCTKLESVIIYGNISQISWQAFSYCSSLSSFVYYGTKVHTNSCAGVFKWSKVKVVILMKKQSKNYHSV